jgi:DNA helicase II / ATP-dependent DNA helicase PcrA
MSHESFEQLYEQLNDRQKQAVDQIEGPVMVVAGPGTGKTQILAARIAKILRLTDTNPSQILCLTYTDAGVVAMRDRLLKFIGPAAYRVNIHTFHSLCNEIIQFNSSYFGYRNLQAASDLDVYDIIREIVDELPNDHLLKRLKGEVYFDVDDLKNLFDIIKKEHFDLEDLKSKAEQYFKNKEENGDFVYKVNGKNFKKGDIKEKDFREERLKVDRLTAALDLYSVFKEKMIVKKLYDFSDMIIWVLDAFKNDSDFLLTYQERYLYMLVDEFQDTNGAQLDLVNYLSDYWEVPNLFVVGDDDQSIYRFQGANLDNILNFAVKYKEHLNTTVLTDNYRSSQPILDASRALINLNGERLKDIDKNLVAQNEKYNQINEKVKIERYLNPIHETVAIGERILELFKQGVPFNEMAVLYRNHRHVEDLIKYFNANEIPYNSKRKVNILNEMLVKKLLTLLKYIEAEASKPYSGEQYIFEILNYDFYHIHPLDLAKMSVVVKNKKGGKWRDVLNEEIAGQQDLFANLPGYSSKTEIKRLANDMEYWIRESVNLTVPQLVEKIIAKGGILSHVLQADSKRWQMQILRTFFDFVKEEASRKPEMTLKDFLEAVETYITFAVPVDAMQVMHMPDSVNLMTMHGSKGLEFEYVFIIRSLDNEWMKKRGNSRDFGLSKILKEDKDELSEIDELRRLMYVGMTRAKKELLLTYYQKDLKEKELNKLQFLAELEEMADLETEEKSIGDEAILKFEAEYYQYETVPDFELLDHDYLDVLLEKYTLSATHLNTYLKCPITFYFNHVLRVPSAKSESASYGTAIHGALEELFRRKQDHPQKQLPSSSELNEFFDFNMYLNRDSFTEKGYKRYLANGKLILPKYYEQYKDEWEQESVYSIEKNMTNIEIEGVPIKGKLDKILFDGKMAYVIDFKTGDFEKAIKKCKPPKDNPREGNFEDTFGGDYWRQMVFYHLLIRQDKNNQWEMLKGEMNFVEPNKHDQFHNEVFVMKPDETQIVIDQIKSSYKSIKNHEFEKGCGEENCHWCNFVKYYLKKEIYVSDSLPGSKVEEDEGN